MTASGEISRLEVSSALKSIDALVSPFGSAADRHAVTWAKRCGLIDSQEHEQQLLSARPGTLAAYCYPSAGRSDLFLLADWLTWLFLIDDLSSVDAFGREPQALGFVVSSILSEMGRTESNTGNSLARGLSDIVRRSNSRMPALWRYRFLQHILDYLMANVCRAGHRNAGQEADLDTFPRLRSDAGAVMPSFDLIEFAVAGALPPAVYYSRTYQRLLRCAGNVVCWTSDLMTFERSPADADTQNLVCVIAHDAGISLDHAAATVVEDTDREVTRFLETEEELDDLLGSLKASDGTVLSARSCATMLRSWMRGHMEWHQITR